MSFWLLFAVSSGCSFLAITLIVGLGAMLIETIPYTCTDHEARVFEI